MHRVVRMTAAALVVLPVVVTGCHRGDGGGDKAAQPTQRAVSEIGVEMRSKQPRYAAGALPELSVVLRNNGSGECSLPSVGTGSVEILSVRRDGVAVIGRPGQEHFYDGMASVVSDSLRAVPPGETLTVSVDAETDADGKARLTSTKQTEADDGRITSWVLDQPGRYQVTARVAPASELSKPDTPPLCQTPTPSATVDFEVA